MSPWGAALFVVAVAGALAGTAPLPARLRSLERIPGWLVPAVAAAAAVAGGLVHPDELGDWLGPLGPALAFLLAGVPLALLLDRLGFFAAGAALIARREASVLGLWIAAAVTTALLNLDTTVVLLTPLYIRLARRTGHDVLALAMIPFLLANLASLALPVSNLTGLIAAEQWSVTAGELFVRVGIPTVAASTVGWFAYRRRWPSPVAAHGPRSRGAGVDGAGVDDGDDNDAGADVGVGVAGVGVDVVGVDVVGVDGTGVGPDEGAAVGDGGGPTDLRTDTAPTDRRALVEGGIVVAVVLVGFVAGPLVGVAAWMVALVADVVLVVRTRSMPWRAVPVDSALLVLSLAIVTAAAIPEGLAGSLPSGGLAADAATAGLGVALANVANNLPALLAGIHGTTEATATGWAWLVGVSLGPVLTPLGSLANLLWWRSAREHGVAVRAGDIVAVGVRVGGPALVAGVLTFLALQVVHG